MNKDKYMLGTILRSKKNKNYFEITQISKTFDGYGSTAKYTYRLKYLDSVNVYKEINLSNLTKYYDIVENYSL